MDEHEEFSDAEMTIDEFTENLKKRLRDNKTMVKAVFNIDVEDDYPEDADLFWQLYEDDIRKEGIDRILRREDI